ncbi:MAG: 2-C-methyl-D-erythritol 2,4-cyclodiphosphate synthase [Spirochaetes bacterium GWF1_51_8]|nr:MAG: 2-C-methyl-D-erythritol 2,4-cyclodiphosphate synthase [Spirochaetes bacterium GWF1_51_8]
MPGVALGYDLHKLVPGRELIVGGVKLESKFGAEAHSDGDALLHAVIDTLLSAAGLDDIGVQFPDNDPAYRGISSLELLREVWKRVSGKIVLYNIDTVVILEQPKIAPHIAEMKQNIASILGISTDKIGIKGKTAENTRLFTIEAHAVCLFEQSSP